VRPSRMRDVSVLATISAAGPHQPAHHVDERGGGDEDMVDQDGREHDA
jgi:hypothetical protein